MTNIQDVTNGSGSGRRRSPAVIVSVLLIASLVGVGIVQLQQDDKVEAAIVVGDGTISEHAGASCWSIKQSYPNSPDGTYWVQTPALIAPMRVYCDMTTDGGGWVLVGRGRDGWNWPSTGQGVQSAIATTPSGTDAFGVAAYSNKIIDGLLNNTRPDSLDDGIRLRRATNNTGTSWQDIRWKLEGPRPGFGGRDRWTWAFGAGISLDSVSINGVSYGKANTYFSGSNLTGQTGASPNLTGVNAWMTYNNNFPNRRGGFGFNSNTGGNTAATSYWYYNGTRTVPFTQVWLRPKISEAAQPAIPATGTPESTVRKFLKSNPEALNWGVTDNVDPTDQFPDLNSLVMGFAQIGDTVYVGGEYQNVQNGTGATKIAQPYLAAFDANTGAWRSGFRPQVNGTVFDVRATPDGKLLVGGSFTDINGAANTAGLAALDPVTGAVLPSWSASLVRNDGSAKRALTRTMAIKGNWLYVGGYFTGISGGVASPATMGAANIVRVSIEDGRPDTTWLPTVSANLFHLEPSPSSDRVWLAGNFVSVNGQFARRIAAVSTVDGSRADPANMQQWQPSQPMADPTQPSECCEYQYVIHEEGNSIWNAGSQHNITKSSLATYTQERYSETAAGGDFQGMTSQNGIIYAGCHCTNFTWTDQDIYTHPSQYPKATQADAINSFGAWDAVTGEYLTEFYPSIYTTVGEGPWEFFNDNAGCMWVGGDFDRGGWNGTGFDYVGGFAKFCNRDTTAPSVPTNLALTTNGGRAQLTWTASTDNSPTSIRYEILRDDRVIATVWGTYYLDPDSSAGSNYFVRAVDETNNRSASTAAKNFFVQQPPATLVAAADTWRYLDDGSNQGTAWRLPSTSVATWPTGVAPLGKALSPTTAIPTTGITQYFVKDFNVANPASIATLRLTLRADDGAVVYLNGNEIARHNMPFGSPLFSTPAWAAQTVSPFDLNFDLPKDGLVTGPNRLAVELHQSAAADVDSIFSATLIGNAPTTDVIAPTAPTVTAPTINNTSVRVDWTASTDNVAPVAYRLQRNGVTISYRNAGSTLTYTDQQLVPGTAYSYTVKAIDVAGNESPEGSVVATTTGGAPVPIGVVSPSTWRYESSGTDQGTAWRLPATSLASWSTGLSPLGKALGETTAIPATGVTQYFAQDFNVASLTGIGTLLLQFRADDGAVVYLNGNEIARSNMPFGPPGFLTTAWAAQVGQPGLQTVALPKDGLVQGTNRLAVEVHQAVANDTDAFFDATISGVATSTDVTAPTAPGALTVTERTKTAIRLTWTASTDNVGVVVYRLKRGTTTIAYRQASSSLTYFEQQLTQGTNYTFTVVAVDAAGNESPVATVATSTLP